MKIPNNGFSLVEIAVALVIIGLLLGGLIMPFTVQMEQQRIERTDETLEEIKEALLGFAIIHQRLPCADINNNGIENFPCDTIATNLEGSLPWADLGVGRYDGWGNPFRYRVDKEYTNGIPNSLKTDVDNKLTVKDKQIGHSLTSREKYENLLPPPTFIYHSRIVAIIFSYGKNGVAESGNEITMANDATYYYGAFIENLADNFDDQTTWLSKYTLMNRLISTKQWPPEQWIP